MTGDVLIKQADGDLLLCLDSHHALITT